MPPKPAIPVGLGPAGSLGAASAAPHPLAGQAVLHPLYERALAAQTLDADHIGGLITARLAYWLRVGERLESHRASWLASLPRHASRLHSATGLHGPLLLAMHEHLASRGYPDASVVRHASAGFPSAGVLPRSHLWPVAQGCFERASGLLSVQEACAGTLERLRRWQLSRQPDRHAEALVERHVSSVKAGREQDISMVDLVSEGQVLVHPCFMVSQGQKLREIMDCSIGLLNRCHTSAEKLKLPSVDDPLDLASRLHRAAVVPTIAVADERAAFRNWPNDAPNLHIAAIIGGGHRADGSRSDASLRLFKDNALSFGDGSSVYGYNRIRCLITVFVIFEFFLALLVIFR